MHAGLSRSATRAPLARSLTLALMHAGLSSLRHTRPSRSRSRSRSRSPNLSQSLPHAQHDTYTRASADEPAVDPLAPAELPMCIACDHFVSTTYQKVCTTECAYEWDNLYWAPSSLVKLTFDWGDRTNDRKQRLETIRASHCVDPSPLDVTGEWGGTWIESATSTYIGKWTIGGAPSNPAGWINIVGKTSYPSFPCTGDLTYGGEVNGVHTFKDTIVTGRDVCADSTYEVSVSAAGELTIGYVVPRVTMKSVVPIASMTRTPYHIDCSACGWCDASPVTASVVQEHTRSNETGGTVAPVFTATSVEWTKETATLESATLRSRRRAQDRFTVGTISKIDGVESEVMYATELEAITATTVNDVTTVAPEPSTDFFTCYPKEPLSEKMKVCQVGVDWTEPANQVRDLFSPLLSSSHILSSLLERAPPLALTHRRFFPPTSRARDTTDTHAHTHTHTHRGPQCTRPIDVVVLLDESASITDAQVSVLYVPLHFTRILLTI